MNTDSTADQTEFEYAQAINAALRRGDSDHANELSVGLSQYRELYKVAYGFKPEGERT